MRAAVPGLGLFDQTLCALIRGCNRLSTWSQSSLSLRFGGGRTISLQRSAVADLMASLISGQERGEGARESSSEVLAVMICRAGNETDPCCSDGLTKLTLRTPLGCLSCLLVAARRDCLSFWKEVPVPDVAAGVVLVVMD